MGLIDNCNFKGISGATFLFTTSGVNADVSQPMQPLSDITSVRKIR
jgi:hypothetical protein